jgi:hypothetical protein
VLTNVLQSGVFPFITPPRTDEALNFYPAVPTRWSEKNGIPAPISALIPPAHIRAAIEQPDARVWVASEKYGSEIVGVALTHTVSAHDFGQHVADRDMLDRLHHYLCDLPAEATFLAIDHMVVQASRRRRGTGHRLVWEMARAFQRDEGGQVMFVLLSERTIVVAPDRLEETKDVLAKSKMFFEAAEFVGLGPVSTGPWKDSFLYIKRLK